MHKTISNCRSRIDYLLDNREYSKAIIELKKINYQDLKNYTKLEHSEFLYLYARYLFGNGNYLNSLRKIKMALKLSRVSSNHSLYASQKQLLGMIYGALGNQDESIEQFIEAYAFRKRAGEYPLIYGTLVNMALAHFVKGNLEQAYTVINDAIKYASKYNGQSEVRLCNLNKSRIAIFLGKFGVSNLILSKYKNGDTNKAESSFILESFGIINTFLLEKTISSKYLLKAHKYYSKLSMQREQIVCLEYLGLNEYFAGNYDKAKEYYQNILERKEITASAKAQTLRMLTDVYIADNNLDKAISTAEKAESAITKISERIELGALYRAWGEINSLQTNVDKAKDYFRKSITLLRDINARYELALTYLSCGQAEIFSKQERFIYLSHSKNLFEAMAVKKRIEQVDNILSQYKPFNQITSYPQFTEWIPGKSDTNTPVVIAESFEMKQILAKIGNIAESDLKVLLTGETGTGKDLIAKYIHHLSKRTGEFVSVNSSAIPNEIVEAELFGCVKGAYTGACDNRVGLIESADGGTFYLNEIADASPEFQVKLLEVLETGEIRRLGENRKRPVNFRVIAATNHNIDKLLSEKRFREDLYYRLSEFTIKLPTLATRKGDIPSLVVHFLKKCGYQPDNNGSREILRKLSTHFSELQLPGNIRQLQSEIRRLWFESGCNLSEMLGLTVQSVSERELFLEALKRNNGNIAATAREFGIPESTLRYKLNKDN